MPARHNRLASCSAPRFVYGRRPSYPRPHPARMCHARVAINSRHSVPHITSPCPKCPPYTTPKYTCAASAAAMAAFFSRAFAPTLDMAFVPICDSCVPRLVAAQPAHHRLAPSTSTALSPTVTLTSYSPCACAIELRTVLDQGFCYDCVRATLDPRADQTISRLIDHPTHTDPLPHKRGWTCLCGKNFNTKTRGRALHNASICLGCAHYKVRSADPDLETSPRSSSSFSTITDLEDVSSASSPSTPRTTPTSPLPVTFNNPRNRSNIEDQDKDPDSPMTGTETVGFSNINYQQIGRSGITIDDEDVGPMGERLEDL